MQTLNLPAHGWNTWPQTSQQWKIFHVAIDTIPWCKDKRLIATTGKTGDNFESSDARGCQRWGNACAVLLWIVLIGSPKPLNRTMQKVKNVERHARREAVLVVPIPKTANNRLWFDVLFVFFWKFSSSSLLWSNHLWHAMFFFSISLLVGVVVNIEDVPALERRFEARRWCLERRTKSASYMAVKMGGCCLGLLSLLWNIL